MSDKIGDLEISCSIAEVVVSGPILESFMPSAIALFERVSEVLALNFSVFIIIFFLLIA